MSDGQEGGGRLVEAVSFRIVSFIDPFVAFPPTQEGLASQVIA